MIFEDPLVHTRISVDGVVRYFICGLIMAATLLLAHLLHRHRETD